MRPTIHRSRPAETATAGAGVVVVALSQLFGVNLTDQQLQALIVLLGFLPAVVTFFVAKRRSSTP